MKATVQKQIIVPRFTSFAGAGTFATAPLNVRAFSEAYFMFLHVGVLTGTADDVYVQESHDLETWTDIGAALPSFSYTNDEAELRSLRLEWMRLRIVLSGTDPAMTCWCVADLIRRES